MRVYNNSGEEYEDAHVRLVVGKVNLVEKIAQLAQVPMSEVAEMDEKEVLSFRISAMKDSLAKAEGGRSGPKPGVPRRPKEVIKEGLSEYFIYTIEGTETVPNGWSKRMRSMPPVQVPIKIQYRYREPEYGPQLVRMYLMKNDVESKLGTTPLPDGVFRIFRDNGRDGLSFLVAQQLKYIPIGDRIELNLGVDPEVIFELVKLRFARDHIWMQIHGANVYRRVDAPGVEIDVRSTVAGWDDHTVWSQRVRNYTAKPIDLEIRRSFDGHVEFLSTLKARNHDYRTVEYTATVEPGTKADLEYETVEHMGRNKKQDNVTVSRRP